MFNMKDDLSTRQHGYVNNDDSKMCHLLISQMYDQYVTYCAFQVLNLHGQFKYMHG